MDTLAALERLLIRAGHRVVTASSLASALEFAETEVFDLVISDLALPDGSGLQLMAQLRTIHGLTGIALSGYDTEEDLRRSHEVGFFTHLRKPVDFAQLRQTIEQYHRE